MTPTRLLAAGVLASALGLAAAPARASSPTELLGPLVDAVRSFCGFYVAGADAKLFNDATLVVLMREGTRTVLSMQNDYRGPPEDFALVIPVPVVLQEGDEAAEPDHQHRAEALLAGLINAKGPQDLLIHILAKQQRYHVANYPNAIIPTNLEVEDITKQQFGKFYVSLFDHTLANTPGAVVTEYAWAAGSCDPCPEPALTLSELYMLGADVLPSYAQSLRTIEQGTVSPELEWQIPSEFVLTRLHARYDASALAEDLVFAEAPPIGGGREWPQRADGSLEIGPIDQVGGTNDFQARYIIRHAWEGKIECQDPLRGVWGGPPSGAQRPTIARQTAFEDRSASLASFVSAGASRVALGLGPPPVTIDPPKSEPAESPPEHPKAGDEQTRKKTDTNEGRPGCACSAGEDVQARPLGLAALALLGLSTLRTPRRRRNPT